MKTLGLILFTLFFYPLPVLANPVLANFCESRAFVIHFTRSIGLDLANKSGLSKKKVNREDIKLPPRTHEEARLKQQGFDSVWTKGLDKLNEWIALRKSLEKLRANPYTTHIQYFADQVEAHLSFAKAGFGNTANKELKKELSLLKEEATKAILEEKVTYNWWLAFNSRITLLHDPDLTVGYKRHRRTQRIISQFPLQIAIPTTEGRMGIITLNRAQSAGVYPIGIANRETVADGAWLSPYSFMVHDMSHAYDSIFRLNSFRYSSLKDKSLRAMIENLSEEKRKQAELVYFFLTHELRPWHKNPLFTSKLREEIAEDIALIFNQALEDEVSTPEVALGQHYFNKVREEQIATQPIRTMRGFILPPLDLGVSRPHFSRSKRIQYIREHIIEDFMQEVYDPIF